MKCPDCGNEAKQKKETITVQVNGKEQKNVFVTTTCIKGHISCRNESAEQRPQFDYPNPFYVTF